MALKHRSEAQLLYGVKAGKLLEGGEAPKQRIYKESSEQSTIAGYIKKYYPDLPFETVKHEGKKKEWEQNQHKKQNSADSFPDTRVYFPHITLMIENKALGTSLTDSEGRLVSMHLQNQYMTHKRLFNAHTKVYFAVGIDEAIKLFESVKDGNYPPMQVFKDFKGYTSHEQAAADFLKQHGL